MTRGKTMLELELGEVQDCAAAIMEAVNAIDSDAEARRFFYGEEKGHKAISALWGCLVVLTSEHYSYIDDLRDRVKLWGSDGRELPSIPPEGLEEIERQEAEDRAVFDD